MVPTSDPRELILSKDDMEGALALSQEANWNQTAEDWLLFMRRGEAYGVRAGGRLVASAAILPFGGGFGWISMVLVTADWRRRGLASRLMNRCIDALRARGDAALLDATPQGALVYNQLGFITQCGMARWRGAGKGSAGHAAPPAPDVREKLLQRDLEAFGGNRAFLLNGFLGREGTSVVGTGEDFAILRRGRRATQIGPLVARDEETGRAILDEAIARSQGPVIVDLLDAGAALAPVLEAHGFEAFRTFERMLLDRDNLPGRLEEMMIAAGPEFG